MHDRPVPAPTTLFAVSHGPEWLRRTSREVAALLLYRALEHPADDASLVGIWMADPDTGDPPCVLHVPGGRQRLHVRDTVGVGGIWTLCWIDGSVSRDTLVAALVGGTAGDRSAPVGPFVPVYRDDEPEAAHSESRHLAERYPGRVADPLCHHVATGRVVPFARRPDPTL